MFLPRRRTISLLTDMILISGAVSAFKPSSNSQTIPLDPNLVLFGIG